MFAMLVWTHVTRRPDLIPDPPKGPVDGQILCSNGGGSCSWTVPAPANVTHTLKATAYDAAGNFASASITVKSATDGQSPTLTITNPLNNALVRVGSTVSISAQASDNVGVTRVLVYVNSSLLCTLTAAPYTCNWVVPSQIGQTYKIKVVAYDAAGKNSSKQVSVKSTA